MLQVEHYYHRGSLTDILLALIARSGTIGNSYLAIVSNDKSNYYGLVGDEFLANFQPHPENTHMRLVLRVNDRELKCLHNVFEALQGDMFK